MNEFLKETFRPNTESEWQAIRRYRRRKAVTGLAGMALALVMLACFLLPKALFTAQLQGTWIPADEYADGYQAEDDRLEFRDDHFYLNGSKYGYLVMKDGNVIEQGNHEALLARGGFYASLYNSQFS